MPLASFKPFMNRLLREYEIYKGVIKLGLNDDLDILANDVMPDIITETFGTSKRASRIRMRQTGFVIPSVSKY
jgi:hypothetical protein